MVSSQHNKHGSNHTYICYADRCPIDQGLWRRHVQASYYLQGLQYDAETFRIINKLSNHPESDCQSYAHSIQIKGGGLLHWDVSE